MSTTIRVLTVEDSDEDAAIVERVLRSAGGDQQPSMVSQRASSIEEAMGVLDQHAVDIVLLDLSLPDADGLEGLKSIRATDPTVPVIVLTGLSDQSTAVQAIHAGAQDFILKDLSQHMLVRSIGYALERSRIVLELEEATNRALAAVRAKSNFLANMSHEIRTPLTAISGFIEVAMSCDVEGERQRALEIALRNAEHLLRLIDDLLDVSKIEAAKLVIERIPCNVFDVLADIQMSMEGKAKEKGLSFEIEYLSPLPERITTDPTRLRQILYNLIGNGVKFTQSGGVTMSVSCERASQILHFTVSDTGIGIAKDKQARLFQPFAQGDSSTTRKFGGTGLGLALSKQLIEMLGGTITLNSEEGKGTTFNFSIATGSLNEAHFVEYTPRSAQSELRTPKEKPKFTGKVLVADDGEDNRELLRYLLKSAGLTTVVVENGEEAMKRALRENFDLIIMDMQMPVMDGYTAVRKLRASGYEKPILAVTASTLQEAAHRCVKIGCDGYLRKPFRHEEFYQNIHPYLRLDSATRPRREEPAAHVPAADGFGPAIKGFVKNLPKRIEALETAAKRKDWQAIQNISHKLISASLFGLEEIGDKAKEIERLIADKNTNLALETIDQVIGLCSTALQDTDELERQMTVFLEEGP